MADFALLGEAVTQARGGKPGKFSRCYDENRSTGAANSIEASVVGREISRALVANDGIDGTVGEIYQQLRAVAGEGRWPASERAFSEELRRLSPALKLLGIVVERGNRSSRGYLLRIAKL